MTKLTLNSCHLILLLRHTGVSQLGKDFTEHIISTYNTSWPSGPHDTQVDSWVHNLDCMQQINIIPIESLPETTICRCFSDRGAFLSWNIKYQK